MAAAGRDGQPGAAGRHRQDLICVVPAKAGTHSHRRRLFIKAINSGRLKSSGRGVWVHASPGTTMLRDQSWLLQKSLSRTGAGMITIRAANTTRDMEECFRIRAEVFIVEQGVPADLERDEHDSKALHFIALADGQSVGTARVVLGDRGTSAKIGRMAVYRVEQRSWYWQVVDRRY
jgi:hypothetical protein